MIIKQIKKLFFVSSSETYEIFHDSYFAPFDDDAKAYQNNLILTEELRTKNSSFIILQLLKVKIFFCEFPPKSKAMKNCCGSEN